MTLDHSWALGLNSKVMSMVTNKRGCVMAMPMTGCGLKDDITGILEDTNFEKKSSCLQQVFKMSGRCC